VLLGLGLTCLIALYVLSGAAHDFNTIRYVIPLWAFVPGLVAAAVASQTRRPATGRVPACMALGVLLAGWASGQIALWQQIGTPAPLRPVAAALVREDIPAATSELFDSHLLSYLTAQHCRVAEFEPFWARLAHFRPLAEARPRVRYAVNLDETDWNS